MSDMISTETILAKKTSKKETHKKIKEKGNYNLEEQQNGLQDSITEKKAGKKNKKMKVVEAKANNKEELNEMIEQKALKAIEKQMKRAEKKALQEKPIFFFSVSGPAWLEFQNTSNSSCKYRNDEV